MVIKSPTPDVVIPDVGVYEFVFGALAPDELDRIAIVDGTSGATTSYGQLREQVLAIAGGLAARGIRPGDVVALHAPNTPAFAAAFHGIVRAGGVVTPINAVYTADEIDFQLRDSGAKLLLTVSPLLVNAGPGAEKAGFATTQVIVLDGADGYASLKDLLSTGSPAPDVTIDPAKDLATLPYSSGTTCKPKGVMLTHRNLVANVVQSNPYIELLPEDVVIAFLPFTHIYGLTVLLNIALARRAELVTMPRFDLPQFLSIIQDRKVSAAFIAPPVAVALAKHPLIDEFDLSSLRFVMSGGAPLDGRLADSVAARLATNVFQGYGMTEMSPVSHVIPQARPDIDRGTIGLLVPNSEMRIVDIVTGEDVEVPAEGLSEPGELLVRGPQIMAGYLNNPEATAATIEPDGFLHTGDIAQVDARGVVVIADRLKELIKYKGHQVPPAELEALLLTHQQVADAAVIGVLDEEAGEIPKAFIVRQAGSELTEADLIAWVTERVAPYKKIRAVEFIDVVPKSSSGKILRKDLRVRDTGAVPAR